MSNNRLILWLATFTLTAFPIGGFIMAKYISGLNVKEILTFHESWWLNVLVGTGVGLVSGFVAWIVIQMNFMKPVRDKYAGLIGSLRLNTIQIIYISICAGVGEEILFRGGMQPWLGIWWTAIIFVALHGYLNPTDWRVSIYGGIMTLIIAGLGYMTRELGIVSAMIAHAVIDIILLMKLTRRRTYKSVNGTLVDDSDFWQQYEDYKSGPEDTFETEDQDYEEEG